MPWIDFLISPFQYPFMMRGLMAVIFTGVVCATVGTYVVLRGMAFFGDALAHAILPGVAIGYWVEGGAKDAVFWWGAATAILVSLGMGAISKGAKIKEDTADDNIAINTVNKSKPVKSGEAIIKESIAT